MGSLADPLLPKDENHENCKEADPAQKMLRDFSVPDLSTVAHHGYRVPEPSVGPASSSAGFQGHGVSGSPSVPDLTVHHGYNMYGSPSVPDLRAVLQRERRIARSSRPSTASGFREHRQSGHQHKHKYPGSPRPDNRLHDLSKALENHELTRAIVNHESSLPESTLPDPTLPVNNEKFKVLDHTRHSKNHETAIPIAPRPSEHHSAHRPPLPRKTRIGSLPKILKARRVYRRLLSHPGDELQRFRASLLFLGLDQSTATRMAFSWLFFLLFTIVVPAVNAFFVSCEKCDDDHSHPFQLLVDYSESALAAVSFLCLSSILRKFGLRKVLLLDKVCDDSMDVRNNYETELQNAFKLLAWILLPCIIVELIHKGWWYYYVSVELPFLARDPILNVFLCIGSIVAWLYKSMVFLFVCVLFRLMCSLQIFRLQGYIKLLEETTDVGVILQEHMRIRDQLSTISHRFRVFVVLSMLTITLSQLYSLFVISDAQNNINFFRAGDLVVCSIVQLSGFVICLHGAAKITHRAQKIMSIVTQWHAVVTCSPNAMLVSTMDLNASTHSLGPAHPLLYNEATGDLEASINVTSRPPVHPTHDPEEYHKRQALVNYLQFSNAGISLFGFVLDRGFLYSAFGIELNLILYILGHLLLT
ncbi:hypothetical protein Mapa_000814 [Marchantia paleacea]|nr:hypothetical protein Mapa_000814 [Marchantia paleacea]